MDSDQRDLVKEMAQTVEIASESVHKLQEELDMKQGQLQILDERLGAYASTCILKQQNEALHQ
jgi:hypothetical protein